MKTKNRYLEVIHHRLAELNLAQLPVQVIDRMEAELQEDFAKMVQRKLTTNSIASLVAKALRQRKAAAQPAPDSVPGTVANGQGE